MNYAEMMTKANPRTKHPAYPDMVKNNTNEGYSFKITGEEQLKRFLLIGSTGGTYYVNEQKLTVDNAAEIIKLIKIHGESVMDILFDTVTNNRAPKYDTVLFVAALCATYGNLETRRDLYSNLNKICHTGTHLLTFVSQTNQLKGWSAGLRKAVARWYTEKEIETLTYQILKYRNRAGFTHRDVLRLCHAKATSVEMNEIFKYIVSGVVPETTNKMILGFEAAKNLEGKILSDTIIKNKLAWEMVPTEQLNEPNVLKALLPEMKPTAMIRNLNRFANAKLTDGLSDTTKEIITTKLNKASIKYSKLHPVNIINYLRTYASGRGFKGDSTWSVNQKIVDALEDAYHSAVENYTPTNKSILIGLDVSGSMNDLVGGTSFTATQLGAVLALTTLKTEPLAELVAFDTMIREIALGKRTAITDAMKAVTHGGGTDCSVPIQYALQTKRKFDAIVILTDSETWAGKRHSVDLLKEYRQKVNKDVKIIEVAMVANGVSNFPSDDANVLRIVGFDGSVNEVIAKFIG